MLSCSRENFEQVKVSIGQHFITQIKVKNHVQETPFYRRKSIKTSQMKVWQVSPPYWCKSSPLRRRHVEFHAFLAYISICTPLLLFYTLLSFLFTLNCWTKCVQVLKNPNPLKDDERLVVLVVVELSFR